MTDRRKFNKPPRATRSDKIYDKVMSVRVVEKDLDELKTLMNKRYKGRKIFLNSVSWVVRNAIKRRIRELS